MVLPPPLSNEPSTTIDDHQGASTGEGFTRHSPSPSIESCVANLAVSGAGTAAAPVPDPDHDLQHGLKEDSKTQYGGSIQAPSTARNEQAFSHGPRLEEGEEGAGSRTTTPAPTDIEHLPVEDDPRLWSPTRKWVIVFICSYGALVPTMAGSMFFPAIEDLKRELGASEQSISLAVSLYILMQGLFPLLWSPISELIGRKPCFVSAMAFFTIMTGFTSLAKNMATVIALRALAAGGSSVTLAIAAGTLADLYEIEERGVKVGIYYAIPICGPALGPIVGGAVTEAAGWKAVFWFLAAAGAASTLAYCCLKETFRTERSAAWQKARAAAIKKAQKKSAAADEVKLDEIERPHERPAYQSGSSGREQDTHQPHQAPAYHQSDKASEAQVALVGNQGGVETSADAAKQKPRRMSLSRAVSHRSVGAASRVRTRDGQEIKVKPALSDISPLGSAGHVLSQPHNLAALIYSGIAFAAQYSLSFTVTTTFTAAPYNYSPIIIGCVLLSLGVGGMVGSIVGGKISDWRLRKVMKKTGRKAAPEERLRTILLPMFLVVPAYAGYGWAAQYNANIAAPVVILVVLGYAQIHCYSVDLSYLVDSNPGRSSGAVAVNSAFRGVLAFVASEVCSPILRAVNNGPLQTGWAVLITFSALLLVMTISKGGQWRSEEWRWPRFWKASQWSSHREGGAHWVQQRAVERAEMSQSQAVKS